MKSERDILTKGDIIKNNTSVKDIILYQYVRRYNQEEQIS